jgi:hypothetical protein
LFGFFILSLFHAQRKLIKNSSKTQRKLDTRKIFYVVIRLVLSRNGRGLMNQARHYGADESAPYYLMLYFWLSSLSVMAS